MEFDMRELAYCGLYCPECSFRMAYETGDRAHIDAVPDSMAHLKQKSLQECRCEGCKADNNICGDCQIRTCAGNQGIETCAMCERFPCEKIASFDHDEKRHHAEALGTLMVIRDQGLEAAFDCICRRSADGRYSWYYRNADAKQEEEYQSKP